MSIDYGVNAPNREDSRFNEKFDDNDAKLKRTMDKFTSTNIQSNGSREGNNFVKSFRKAEVSLQGKRKKFILAAVDRGCIYVRSNDGWTDIQKNSFIDVNASWKIKEIEIGDKICIGEEGYGFFDALIVKITESVFGITTYFYKKD